jgi:hypothetical protein
MGWARGQITLPKESLVPYIKHSILFDRGPPHNEGSAHRLHRHCTAIYCCIKAYLCTTGPGMGTAFNLSKETGLLLLKQEHKRPALFLKSSFRHLIELRSTVLELLCSFLELSYYTLLELLSYYLEHYAVFSIEHLSSSYTYPFFLYLELFSSLFL